MSTSYLNVFEGSYKRCPQVTNKYYPFLPKPNAGHSKEQNKNNN